MPYASVGPSLLKLEEGFQVLFLQIVFHQAASWHVFCQSRDPGPFYLIYDGSHEFETFRGPFYVPAVLPSYLGSGTLGGE